MKNGEKGTCRDESLPELWLGEGKMKREPLFEELVRVAQMLAEQLWMEVETEREEPFGWIWLRGDCLWILDSSSDEARRRLVFLICHTKGLRIVPLGEDKVELEFVYVLAG